ncbi:hypothetical protein D3C78_1484610 [compost metagenome]
MPTKTFSKEFLQGLLWRDYDPDKYEVVYNELCDRSRWAVSYEQVFKDKVANKYYITYYSEGATESQEERPYEYDDDEIDCEEVAPVEVVVTQYKAV